MKSTSINSIYLFVTLLSLGLSGPSNQAAPKIYREVGGVVVVEAENFDSRKASEDDDHKWVVVPDEGPGVYEYVNFRGKYMEVQPNSGQNRNNPDVFPVGPTADYKVRINTAGEYRLWLRCMGADGGSDSMYASILELRPDAGGPGPANWYRKAPLPNGLDFNSLNGDIGWDGNGGADVISGDTGGDPMIWNIAKPGVYTVRVYQREDGTGFDTFCLQLSSKPDPSPSIPESPLDSGGAALPLSVSVTPGIDAKNAPFDKGIAVTFVNGTTKLAANSVVLELDGAAVTPASSTQGEVTTVSYVPAAIFAPNSVHKAKVTYKDDKGASSTIDWSFTVRNYNLVPSAWAVNPDRSKPGFRVRVHQISIGRFPGDINLMANAERQLADGYIDPATGKPYANIADLSAAGPGGIFVETATINYSQQDGENNGAFTPDRQMPGIPGVEGGTDNIAMEILTYLELPAGTIRMGVNSDDGFRTSVSPGDPRDQFGTVLGFFDGGRGAADTTFTFVVEKAGVYPFRTSWWEGGGGANIEWFTFNGNTKVLVNDTAAAGHVKAFREAQGGSGPYAKKVVPGAGLVNVAPDTDIEAEIVDQGTVKVLASAIAMKVNGIAVKPTINKSGDVTSVKLASTAVYAPRSVHNVELSFGDGTPANSVTRAWSFTVVDYPTLPVALGTALGSGTTNQRGFRVKTHQVEAGQANSDSRAENQLAGRVGPNVADVAAATGGFFTDDNVINYNQDAPGGVGNFTSDTGYEDEPIPGIPGTTGSTDNIAQEILTYVEFPKAGIVTMGVNSDDGFKVTVAEGFSTNAVRLGIFDGGRGAADTVFFFNVEVPGVYPLRLIWYEGGGGANVEWFTQDKTGNKTLVNDPKKADALKAFRARANTPLPIQQDSPKFAALKREGAELVIEWAGGGTLQSADIVTGPWTDITGASSPRRVTPAPGSRFYRVRR